MPSLRYSIVVNLFFYAHLSSASSNFRELVPQRNSYDEYGEVQLETGPDYSDDKTESIVLNPFDGSSKNIIFSIPRLECKPGQTCLQKLQHKEQNIILPEGAVLEDAKPIRKTNNRVNKGDSEVKVDTDRRLTKEINKISSDYVDINDLFRVKKTKDDNSPFLRNGLLFKKSSSSRKFSKKKSESGSDSDSSSASKEALRKSRSKPKRFAIVRSPNKQGYTIHVENKPSYNNEDSRSVEIKEKKKKVYKPPPKSSEEVIVKQVKKKRNKKKQKQAKETDDGDAFMYMQGPGRVYPLNKYKAPPKPQNEIEDDDNVNFVASLRSNDMKNMKFSKAQSKNEANRARRTRMEHFLPKRIYWSERDLPYLGYLWFDGSHGTSHLAKYNKFW